MTHRGPSQPRPFCDSVIPMGESQPPRSPAGSTALGNTLGSTRRSQSTARRQARRGGKRGGLQHQGFTGKTPLSITVPQPESEATLQRWHRPRKLCRAWKASPQAKQQSGTCGCWSSSTSGPRPGSAQHPASDSSRPTSAVLMAKEAARQKLCSYSLLLPSLINP